MEICLFSPEHRRKPNRRFSRKHRSHLVADSYSPPGTTTISVSQVGENKLFPHVLRQPALPINVIKCAVSYGDPMGPGQRRSGMNTWPAPRAKKLHQCKAKPRQIRPTCPPFETGLAESHLHLGFGGPRFFRELPEHDHYIGNRTSRECCECCWTAVCAIARSGFGHICWAVQTGGLSALSEIKPAKFRGQKRRIGWRMWLKEARGQSL